MKRIMIYVLSLITLSVIHCTNSQNDNHCTTPEGTSGLCINIKSCPPLLSLLLSARQNAENADRLRRFKCHGYGNVCCPEEKKSVENLEKRKKSDKLEKICGKSSVQDVRIVGGKPAELGAWPWIAALGYSTETNSLVWMCAGSLINNRYVLTAAHCIVNTLIKVRLGEHNLRSEYDGASPVDFNIEKMIAHENYIKSKTTVKNDIALVRLEENVVFTDKIQPVCLPESSELRSLNFDGKYLFVVGWGKIRENGSDSDVLQQVQIPVVGNRDCKRAYGNIGVVLTENHICAGDMRGGKDACTGDSGGPLLYPQRNGSYYVIGVTSFGHGCARSGFPGVYTQVKSYIEWINKNIE